MHTNGTQVLKTPLTFYLDGCDSEMTTKYKGVEQESAEFVEREKKVYSHLGSHANILHCLEISDIGLKFPYMRTETYGHSCVEMFQYRPISDHKEEATS